MRRTILHCDLDAFYAGVAALHNPSLHGKAFAVCGSEKERHGIVLAKSQEAKKHGVKTGEVIWQAKQKCPNLLVVKPNFRQITEMSQEAIAIYAQYTDQIARYGPDEAWCDVTGSVHLFGSGEVIATQIREKMQKLGLTVSVGISFNRIFAKLGSDMNKPNGQTLIAEENYKEVVWPLPASDLLFVGPATNKKLYYRGIYTIGDLAQTDPEYLRSYLGVRGVQLWQFANGIESPFVSGLDTDCKQPIKSIGNSTTTAHDLVTERDIKITLFLLSESVAARMRESGYRCQTIQISIRYNDLTWFERQSKLAFDTCTSEKLAEKSWELFQKHSNGTPVRSLGVRACDLIPEEYAQTAILPEYQKDLRKQNIETSIDGLRKRYGNKIIQRATMLADKALSDTDPRGDNTLQSVAFLH